MLPDTPSAHVPVQNGGSAFHIRLERRGWHSPRAAVRIGTLERVGILLRHGMG